MKSRSSKHTAGLQLAFDACSPPSDWKMPESFPDLSKWGVIGLDVETRDPRLKELGPGGLRGDGELVGISIGLWDGMLSESHYFPIAHLGGGNCDRDAVLDWLREELKNPDLRVVGANILYDIEWLSTVGIEIAGKIVDVQVLEALIDEESGRSMSLQSLCQKYLGQGKDEALLIDAAKAHDVDPKSGLWKLHAKYVGPYAEWDALSARQIYHHQLREIDRQNLESIVTLELSLTPLLWKMRRRGVRIDMERAAILEKRLLIEEERLTRELRALTGRDLDMWSSAQIGTLCVSLGIEHPVTTLGNPSITKDFIENHDHPALKMLSELRETNRLRSVFVGDWVSKYVFNGRAYPQWRQLATDDGGTRTGRMASANPNMQQIPARSRSASEIRAMFVPDEGTRWCKLDYSQQEPRLLVHYASLLGMTGARLVSMAYRDNPKMDIYSYLAQASGKARFIAKGATLGRMYGMGSKRFGRENGFSEFEAARILDDFDRRVPFVRELSDKCANVASSRGNIRTIGGRLRHFNLWEPCQREQETTALPLEDARRAWPGQQLRRFGTRKGLNALIQGSAADMTKIAMVQIHEKLGIVPTLSVHDEIDLCVESDEQAAECRKIMETCVRLEVPVIAEMELGDSWK